MLLACDGIWDVYENDAAINFVFQMAGKIDESAVNNGMRSSVAETCDELLLSCLKKGSRDNMTAILLLLNAVTYSNENVTPEAKSVGLAESPGPLDIETALRPEVGDDTSTVGADSSSPLSEIPTRRKLFEQI